MTDQAAKDSVKAAIDTISAGGGTSIGGAAQTALNQLLLPGTPDGTKSVFLLSDGISGDNALAPIPQYVAAQVPIFTFSYGSDADTTTLGEMARRTMGRLYRSPTSLGAVTRAFQSANALASSSSTVASGSGTASPGGRNEFPITVDSTLRLLDVVFTSDDVSSISTIQLVSPSGAKLDPNETDVSGGEKLLLFSVEQPEAGEWTLTVEGNSAQLAFSYQAGALPDGASFALSVDTLEGIRVINYPEPFVLRASLSLDLPIISAEVSAEITAPNGTTFVLQLNDDGIESDENADDGEYSGALNYDQAGVYEVSIRAVTQAGVSSQWGGVYGLSEGPDGEEVPIPPPVPITEKAERLESLQVEIMGVVDDDHGDTMSDATPLPAENLALVSGKIETGGDVDMFQVVVPADSSEIVIRVSGLAFGMEPLLDIFDSSGGNILDLTLLDSQGGYLALLIPNLVGGNTLFARVSHKMSDGTGFYQISAGDTLFVDAPLQVPTPAPTERRVFSYQTIFTYRIGTGGGFSTPTTEELEGLARVTQIFFLRHIASLYSVVFEDVDVTLVSPSVTLYNGKEIVVEYETQVFLRFDGALQDVTAESIRMDLETSNLDIYVTNFVPFAEPGGQLDHIDYAELVVIDLNI